ncbi:ankyrin repeat domain-containing protein, partial [Rhodopirellula bahusiensis]
MLRMILPITGSLLVCLGVVAADPSDRESTEMAGAEVSASDHQWVAAAEQQRWDLVRESLAGDRVNVDASQPDGMTALHWAAYHNHARSIAALVAAGADVDAKTLYEVTPLSLACEYGNLRAVRALLDAGADANAARHGGESPLMLAARQGNANVVRSLIKSGADMEDKEARGQT